MEELDEVPCGSFRTLVFLRMTWHSGDFGPTVVALCIDILRATVPAVNALAAQRRRQSRGGSIIPGFPKTVPKLLMFKESELYKSTSLSSWLSLAVWFSRVRHSRSSLGEQAVMMTSYSWWSHSNTNFHENGAVWHCKPRKVRKSGYDAGRGNVVAHLGHCRRPQP
jgi:hypothetical protein